MTLHAARRSVDTFLT